MYEQPTAPALESRTRIAARRPARRYLMGLPENTRNWDRPGADNSRHIRRASSLQASHSQWVGSSTGFGREIAIPPAEQRNLSTSSFRPPGGPTPTRGFFYLGDPQRGL